MLKKVSGFTVLGFLMLAQPAAAIDIMPGDYTVLPSGTNLALLYGQYTTSSKLKVDGVGSIPDSKLGTAVGIARYVHFDTFAGVPVAVQAFIPFGGFTDARIGGFDLRTKDGLGDLTMGFTFWPVSSADPRGTTIGITSYVTLPSGSFGGTPGTTGTASLGSGTTTFTPQIGLIQGLGNGFFLDASADVAIRSDFTDFGFNYSRDPSYQAQAYLRYQFSKTTNVSFGYSGLFGGKDFVNGTYTGTKTRSDQLRLFASTFLAPTVQLQGMIGTDIAAEGGFKQDFVGQVRLLKIF